MKLTAFLLLVGFFVSCKNNSVLNTSINPGAVWPDEEGVHINAHGGGILY